MLLSGTLQTASEHLVSPAGQWARRIAPPASCGAAGVLKRGCGGGEGSRGEEGARSAESRDAVGCCGHPAGAQAGRGIGRDFPRGFHPLLISVSVQALQGCAFLADKSVLAGKKLAFNILAQLTACSARHPWVLF